MIACDVDEGAPFGVGQIRACLARCPRYQVPHDPIVPEGRQLRSRRARPQPGDSGTPGSRLRAFVLFSEAYPANHAPGVEVAGELTLIAVARHQHDDAPLVDILQVDGGGGAQIAREDFGGLDHHLLADPRLWYLFLRVRGAGPLTVHHSFSLDR